MKLSTFIVCVMLILIAAFAVVTGGAYFIELHVMHLSLRSAMSGAYGIIVGVIAMVAIMFLSERVD